MRLAIYGVAFEFELSSTIIKHTPSQNRIITVVAKQMNINTIFPFLISFISARLAFQILFMYASAWRNKWRACEKETWYECLTIQHKFFFKKDFHQHAEFDNVRKFICIYAWKFRHISKLLEKMWLNCRNFRIRFLFKKVKIHDKNKINHQNLAEFALENLIVTRNTNVLTY